MFDLFSNEETDIHIAGYPRSANTFAKYIFENLDKNLVLSSHLHTVSNIKLSLKYNNNTIVLLRHPLDAITSNIVYRNANKKKHKLDIPIDDYIEYYSFVSKYVDELYLVKFNFLINDTYDCINEINKYFNLNLNVSKQKISKIESEFLENKKDKRSKKLHNTPNALKSKLKNKYKSIIKEREDYKEALSIYNKLLTYF
jgi:hypothetical protein